MEKVDTFGGFRVLGPRLVVRRLPEREKSDSGLLWLPTEVATDSSFKSHVAEVLAVSKGSRSVNKEIDHFFPGSKKWGKTKVEVSTKEYHRQSLEEIKPGDYVVFAHPFVCTDSILIPFDHPDVDKEKFAEKEIDEAGGGVYVYVISEFEIIAVIDPEGSSEKTLAKITSGQISINT